jgi:protein arginine kinase activator
MTQRPIECGQCKKPIKVIYKEIVGESITCTEMCEDCPVLKEKLYGTKPSSAAPEGWSEAKAGLCCSNCRTTFDAVKMGNPLGCQDCYTVFDSLLISELIAAGKLPMRLRKGLASRTPPPIHIGRLTKQSASVLSSSRLTALSEALNEALRKENYEEAAVLRDQIKELMEKKDEPKS